LKISIFELAGANFIYIYVCIPGKICTYFTGGKPRALGILRIGCDYVTTVICNLNSFGSCFYLARHRQEPGT